MVVSLASYIGSQISGSIQQLLYQFFFANPTALSDGILLLFIGLIVAIIPFKATRIVGFIILAVSIILMLLSFGVL